jgi:Domain of unknown function (DUF6460)
MIDEKSAPPPHVNPWPASASGPGSTRRSETLVARFLGGTPAGVLVKLFFLSLIVGALLMWLDIRPVDIFEGFVRIIRRIWALGFDALREMADYLLAGAVIVVPVWFVFRLLSMRGPR